MKTLNIKDMNKEKRNSRLAILIVMIIAAACFRFIKMPPNFSPITGIALFGAAYFSRKYLALIVPFLILWISNLVLDNVFYAQWYEGFQWFSQPLVFVAFGGIVLLGFVFLKKVNFYRIIGASLTASVLFFLVTNFGVWLGSPTYPQSFSGLILCYAAGIPFITNPGAEHYFFLNTVFGDLMFTVGLFGVFELIKFQFPRLAKQRA
ncbi:MAG: hypothetical protein ACI8P3_002703 [Saprospiraceae bacterium]